MKIARRISGTRPQERRHCEGTLSPTLPLALNPLPDLNLHLSLTRFRDPGRPSTRESEMDGPREQQDQRTLSRC
jgi:hypothetical protein